MKQLYTFLLFGLLMQLQLFSQETIPDPEFSERPYYLDNGELKNLERADAVFDIKVKGGGYGGADYFYSAFGEQSPVRFHKDSIPRIFIELDKNVDPEETIVILRKEKKNKKNRRRFKQGSSAMGGKARDVSENRVSFSINKVRPGLYEIIFDHGLLPGEYAVMPINKPSQSIFDSGSNTVKITCFGIDGDIPFDTGENNTTTPSLNNPKKEYPQRTRVSYLSVSAGLAPFYQQSTTSENPLFLLGYEYGLSNKLGISGQFGMGSAIHSSSNEKRRFIAFGLSASYYFFHTGVITLFAEGGLMVWDRLASGLNGVRPIIMLGLDIPVKAPISIRVKAGYGLSALCTSLNYTL